MSKKRPVWEVRFNEILFHVVADSEAEVKAIAVENLRFRKLDPAEADAVDRGLPY